MDELPPFDPGAFGKRRIMYRCGMAMRVPPNCLTAREVERLGLGWRRRLPSTKPRTMYHRLDSGPHRHRVKFVPLPVVNYLRAKRAAERGAPIAEINAVLDWDAIAKQLFEMWETERNARELAHLLATISDHKRAKGLRAQANALREQRKRSVELVCSMVKIPPDSYEKGAPLTPRKDDHATDPE